MRHEAKNANNLYNKQQQARCNHEATEKVTHGAGRDDGIKSRIHVNTAVKGRSAATPRHSRPSLATDATRRRSAPPPGNARNAAATSAATGRRVSTTRSRTPVASKRSSDTAAAATVVQRVEHPSSSSSRCYDQPARVKREPCTTSAQWQNAQYVRDECGSGFVPLGLSFLSHREMWCRTPLSMYQATIGELGRQILCREQVVPRDVKVGPPCGFCQVVLPPCRGYYRKYECVRPCEEEYVAYKAGKKEYRKPLDRYWEPCLMDQQKDNLRHLNRFAGHNVYLAEKTRRRMNMDVPCW